MKGRVMTLEQLIKSLAEKVKGLDALKTAAFADDATEDATKAFDDALGEIEAIEVKIEKAKKVAVLEKAQSEPANDPTDIVKKHATPIEKLSTMQKVGIGIAGLMKSHHEDGNKSWTGIAHHMEKMGYGEVALEFDARQKAMNSTSGAAGGFAVAEDFNEDIFRELAPFTAFLRGGPDSFPMPNGNYRQSGVAARPTAGYRAEGTVIAASEPTLLEINMSAKLLSGLIPITNQLINYTAERASRTAQATLLTTMGLTMDTAGFEGTGAANNPLGIFNVAGINTAVATGATAPTQAQVDTDVRKLLNPIAQFALLQMGVAWIMPQRVKGYLEDMKDAQGQYIYPTLQKDNPTFKGYPVLVPGTIATNLGGGTDETTVALVSFGQVLLGESGGLRIAISDEATYDSGGGTMVSAFANDLTLIRATMEHDWTPRYAEAVGTLTAVRWGG